MQIRLTETNSKDVETLMDIYRQTCPDYDLSKTQQVNRLISGRLKLAITEAQKELAKNPCCKKK